MAEDYMLKQITASLIYPNDEVGKKFWNRIYAVSAQRFGTTNIPVNTFNKVWIVPQKAVVYENSKAGTAYVVESKLKVMLEQDYLSMLKHSLRSADSKQMGILGADIIREVVIPELTKEVNEGKNFTQLRQVYNSLILATWYKKKIKDSILAQVYENRNKITGVNINDPQEKEKIYRQYLKAFKKGVYNFIKEEYNPITQQRIPRKYFSGGMDLAMMGSRLDLHSVFQTIQNSGQILPRRGILLVEANVLPESIADAASTSNPVQGVAQIKPRWNKDIDLSVADGFSEHPATPYTEKLHLRHQEFLKTYHTEHHLIDGSDPEFHDAYEAVQAIFHTLLRTAGLAPSNYRLLLSDEESPNAFYLRGSNVFVLNLGLLKLGSHDNGIALSKDAVAFILAHEMQHLRQYRDDVLNGKVNPDIELKPDWDRIAKEQQQIYLDEYDADWHAVDLMSRAGFNVREAPSVFDLLLKSSVNNFYVPFGSHPNLEPRTFELRNLVLKRYWPNASKPVSFFSNTIEINTSRFRDYQNRVYVMRSDQEFADRINEAEDIRELVVAVSVGKKLWNELGYIAKRSGFSLLYQGNWEKMKSRLRGVLSAINQLRWRLIPSLRLPVQAISDRISRMVENNPQKRLQLRFFEEMLKKYLDRSDQFSPRKIKTEVIKLSDGSKHVRKTAVADPVEFDNLVKDASTGELIAALEDLAPSWISLEGLGRGSTRQFSKTLEGGFYNSIFESDDQIKYERGDYIEFIDAIVRALEKRAQEGTLDREAIPKAIAALKKNHFEEGDSQLQQIRGRLFMLLFRPVASHKVLLNQDIARELVDLIDDLNFLDLAGLFFDHHETEDGVAKVLYDLYKDSQTKPLIVGLFRKHVKNLSDIKLGFYSLLKKDPDLNLEEKLSVIDELGRDKRAFSSLKEIIWQSPYVESSAYTNAIISEIIDKQPALSALRDGSDYLKRLVVYIYLQAIPVDIPLLSQLYDAKNRRSLLSADELHLFRNFISADFGFDLPAGKIAMGDVDSKKQLILLLDLLEFLKRKNLDAEGFRLLSDVYTNHNQGHFVQVDQDFIDTSGQLKDARTFSLFFGELMTRGADYLQEIIDFPTPLSPTPPKPEEGYSVKQMTQRLAHIRPQRFARWDLMQEGDKDPVDYFSFLDSIYHGIGFQEAVADLAHYFPESRLRDIMIHVLFIQKILGDKLGIKVTSDRLFDFEWLRAQVQAKGAPIHEDIQAAVAFLGWDRDIQKMNGLFLGRVQKEPFLVDLPAYQRESPSYTDVRFYDIAGVDSQLPLGIASLDENYLRDFLDANNPLGKKLEMLFGYYPQMSAHRDEYLEHLLEHTLQSLGNGTLNLTSDLELQIVKSLQALQNISIRERLGVRFIEAKLEFIQETKGRLSLEDEQKAILTYFPDHSYTRDEVLNQFVDRQVKTFQQYQKVAHLFVQNPENIRKAQNAGHMFWKDQMRDIVMNLGASSKTELLLWLMGIGEKPKDIIREEYRLQVSFDSLKKSLGLYQGSYYSGIGKRDQQEFFNSLFMGSNGIFRNEEGYDLFLDQIIEGLIPVQRKSVRHIFKTVLTTRDLYRRRNVLLELLQHYGQLQGISNPEEKEARAIRIFLQANDLIGIKLGQFLAHSVLVIPGSYLQRELEELKEDAESMNKGILFDMMEKVYHGRAFEDHFESLDEEIGNASIKVVYRATRKDGSKRAVKFKRPEVDKLIEQDMLFLEDTLNRCAGVLQEEGVPVPVGLVNRLKELFEEELNFGDMLVGGTGEANNQRRLKQNMEHRKSHIRDGVTYEFNVPVSDEVHENSLMVEEFVEDAISLKQEDRLRAQGIDVDVIKELLMEELVQEFFIDGFYHADLHGGNVLIKKVGDIVQINIIDVGAAAHISPANREILVGILMALWDKGHWDSNKDFIYRLFPQIQGDRDLLNELDAIVQSDRNLMQKLMYFFALLEKKNIAFQEKYKEFYSVIRFLKASEYLFSDAIIEKIRARFFPSDIIELMGRSSPITEAIQRELAQVQAPEVTTTAEGLRVTLRRETLVQTFDALTSFKESSFWPAITTPYPQLNRIVDLMIGFIGQCIAQNRDFEFFIPRDKMPVYGDIRNDVQLLLGLIQQGNFSLSTLMGALPAIGRIMSKSDDIIKFVLEQGISKDDIIKYVRQHVGTQAADHLNRFLSERGFDKAMNVWAIDDKKTGGIDLTSDKDFLVQNDGKEIKFHIDPFMLEQIQKFPGLKVSKIIIQPLKSLPAFLGLNQSQTEAYLAAST